MSVEWFDFENKSIALFSPDQLEIAKWVVGEGAKTTYLCGVGEVEHIEGVTRVDIGFWDFAEQNLDYVFVDTRQLADFDHVEDVKRLTTLVQSVLSADGNCFTVFRTGLVQAEWDIYNSVLLTPSGIMPSSPFLYDELLKEFAVRPLLRLTDESVSGCVTRVFRLAPRKPTVLVILGKSQSGKTTLARSLRQLQPGAHFSSDYLYFNLFQLRGKLASASYSDQLLQFLGEATAEDTGNFFRLIEDNVESFREYLALVVELLPREFQLVSMDLDVRRDDRTGVVREVLEAAGFSVWFVTR